MKELFLVCAGSFLGGGMRYLVGRGMACITGTSLPLPTLAVNVVGCFLIGLLSGMAIGGNLSSTAKLLLVTGFCGGFTTFSTFINENLLLARGGQLALAILYAVASMTLGFVAIVAGYKVGS